MSIAIRVDASLEIGSGHVMRCLALAEQSRQRGKRVVFVCRDHPGNLIDMIESKGFGVARLPRPFTDFSAEPGDPPHGEWVGVSWSRDASETSASMGDEKPEWLIVDHYGIDYRWQQQMRAHVGAVMVIDDLADRRHSCDILLDQNMNRDMATRYDCLTPPQCRKLIGPKYALLRPEFAAARKNLRKRDGTVSKVLVFFGSVDPTNETEKALQALSGMSTREFRVDVVVGSRNPHRERIQAICDAQGGFSFHCQVENMAELMASADLAVGAGGTATWERCAVGLPAVVIAVAENQLELSECGAAAGLFVYLGTSASAGSRKIQEVLHALCSLPSLLCSISARASGMVDARGAQRVAGLLAPPPIVIRPATEQDCDSLYQWRNAEETRRYVFDSACIPLENHRTWFLNVLANPDRLVLIGEIEGRPVGVLRYDCHSEEALVSVYLVPGMAGQGVGAELIRRGSRWLREHRPGIRRINAEIRGENIASLRAFEQAGFKEHHVTYQEVLVQ